MLAITSARRRWSDPQIARGLRLASLAAFALVAGAALYLGRGLSSLYLFGSFAGPSAGLEVPAYLQALGYLPTFAHAFAFSLITAVFLSPTMAGACGACLLWACINSLFELLQATQGCPAGLAGVDFWFAELGCAYVSNGYFAASDIVAAWLGAGLAWCVLVRNMDFQSREVEQCSVSLSR